MAAMELFGTTTSPFVRRVRVVAIERGIPFTLVDTFTPEGQERLRAASPVWKVPTAVFASGVVAWDSRVIIEQLCSDGWAPLRAPPVQSAARVDEENVVNAIDEALLSLVRRFYLAKDHAPLDAPWHVKDFARAKGILTWVEARVREDKYVGAFGAGQGFGRAELALFTALQWMRFRDVVDLARWPKLVAFEQSWAARPSLASTAPNAK
jgi:glutathione S-transferase